ncbi:DBF4-type zinc finger-containing protein 2 isoform X2 [Engraulis encrasicolus]
MTARHREVVRSSSSARTGVTTGSLMDRFLQDVMRHHPYHYSDTRPSHMDLPCIATLPPPREELSEVYCGSKGDRASVGTRDEMPSSDDEASTTPATATATATASAGTTQQQQQQRAPPSSQKKKKDIPAPTPTPAKAPSPSPSPSFTKTPTTTTRDKAVDAMPTTSTRSGSNTQPNPPLSRKDSPTQGFMHRTSSLSLRTASNSRCYSRKGQTKADGTQTPAPADATAATTTTNPLQSRAPTTPTTTPTPTPTPVPVTEQPSHSQFLHRKAQRKTNRHRDENESASNSLAGAELSMVPLSIPKATTTNTTSSVPNKPEFEPLSPILWTPTIPPWKSAHREHTFSDASGQISKVIEEVIDTYCYGGLRKQQKTKADYNDDGGYSGSEKGSFHVSLCSMSSSETSKEWDNTVQVAPVDPTAVAPTATTKLEENNLTGLMGSQFSLEDQGYFTQLDSALKPFEESAEMMMMMTGDGTTGVQGVDLSRVVVPEEEEEVLPDLPHIPPAFVGKTWTQVMLEKEQKIDNMVREFREGKFRNYFDSESVACYGRHRRKKKRRPTDVTATVQDAEPLSKLDDGGDAIPLMEHTEEDTAVEDQQTPQKQQEQQPQEQQPPPPVAVEQELQEQPQPVARPQRRVYRLASRCQVVKVSHGTQTTAVSCPVVRRKTALEGMSAALLELQRQEEEELRQQEEDEAEERNANRTTPKRKATAAALNNALRLPSFYSKVMSPLQPKTVVYVLSSPADTLDSISKQPGKRRPGGGRKKKVGNVDDGHKYTYKKNPLKYYDPKTNQILKTPPKGVSRTSNISKYHHPHVRQLFRSLSPDNNKDRCGGGGGGVGVDFGDGWGSQRPGGGGGGPGAWPGCSIADLCASTTGSCLDSAGPSEPGSSLTSSRRALFSRSSMCSSNRFLLGTLTPGPSIADGTAVAPSSQAQASDQDEEEESSGSEQVGGGVRARGRRTRSRAGGGGGGGGGQQEKGRKGRRKSKSTMTKARRSPPDDDNEYSPSPKRRKKTTTTTSASAVTNTSPQLGKRRPGRPPKQQARAQVQVQAAQKAKPTGGRRSPRGVSKGATRSSPRSSPRVQSHLRP